jgi:hypothetical protein
MMIFEPFILEVLVLDKEADKAPDHRFCNDPSQLILRILVIVDG